MRSLRSSLVRLAFDPPLDPARYAFTHSLRARFAETDAMGIVHHASYLAWLEEARVAYLRDLGHPYLELRESGIDFAVLEAFLRYLQPVRFDDVVQIHLVVAAVTRATFQLGYLLSVGGVATTTAVTVHGAVDPTGRPARLPTWLKALAGG